MIYVRVLLLLRNVEILLHERGFDITHETILAWWNQFSPIHAADIERGRRHSLRSHTPWRWHIDETNMRMNGEIHSFRRTVDLEAVCWRCSFQNSGIAVQS